MRMYDIIKKKRDGEILTKDEIRYFIDNYTKGEIPDYQASALLMAIYLNKMNDKETFELTKAVVESGDQIDLTDIKGKIVDKHSTGGVGDSVTLILGPMVAACDVPFVKMSGRGLGHTGGTLDKLESIENFRTSLDIDEFVEMGNNSNFVLASQTADIAPADRKLYALRDVTATVDNLSLISSSIMGKKLATGCDGIVLDVKVGSGAFMKSVKEAEELAKTMVKIGNEYGKDTVAVVTNMDQPLGYAVGNALEIKEAIDILNGEGPEDLYELCLVLGSKLLVLADKTDSETEAREMLKEVVESGEALNKFIELVEQQDGNSDMIKNPELLPKANYIVEVKSVKDGYVKEINAEEIGKCALMLGAGRETMESEIDLSAGIILNKKIDDRVKKGDIIAYIHTNNLETGNKVKKNLEEIYVIGDKNKETQKLIFEEIN